MKKFSNFSRELHESTQIRKAKDADYDHPSINVKYETESGDFYVDDKLNVHFNNSGYRHKFSKEEIIRLLNNKKVKGFENTGFEFESEREQITHSYHDDIIEKLIGAATHPIRPKIR